MIAKKPKTKYKQLAIMCFPPVWVLLVMILIYVFVKSFFKALFFTVKAGYEHEKTMDNMNKTFRKNK